MVADFYHTLEDPEITCPSTSLAVSVQKQISTGLSAIYFDTATSYCQVFFAQIYKFIRHVFIVLFQYK